MMVLDITVMDLATGMVARIIAAADSPSLLRVMGRAATEVLRSHFRARNLSGPRNALGAPSSNFWADVAGSTNDEEPTAGKVLVKVAHPAINQKVYGGTIRMDDKRLAIPARTEAYGKSPRLFSNLEVIVFRSGAVALAVKEMKGKRQKGEKRLAGLGLVYFWLVESVTQQPDPNALPSRESLQAAVLGAGREHFERIKNEEN